MITPQDQIKTVGQLFDALAALESREEGQQFMQEYTEFLKDLYDNSTATAASVARSNVGYVAGYGSPEVRQRIKEYTGAPHPIFD